MLPNTAPFGMMSSHVRSDPRRVFFEAPRRTSCLSTAIGWQLASRARGRGSRVAGLISFPFGPRPEARGPGPESEDTQGAEGGLRVGWVV